MTHRNDTPDRPSPETAGGIPPGTAHGSDEVEWQFDAAELGRVAAWLQSRPPDAEPRVVARSTADQVDDYVDTDDWRVYRAGYSLRLRRKAGGALEATLKGLATSTTGGALRTRREINERIEGAGGEPAGAPDPGSGPDSGAVGRQLAAAPGPVGTWLRDTLAGQPLGPLVTVRTRRTVLDLLQAGEIVGEIALDETRFDAPGHHDALGQLEQAAPSLRRIEVEVGLPSDDLASFVEALAEACALKPAGPSKFETGLAALGLTPP